MKSDNRAMLANFMLCKEDAAPKQYWLHIIAIEDEEQRYVTKVLGTESWIFGRECFVRIAKPKGYEYIWKREHGKKPLIFDTDLAEIENLPPAQRSIEDYQEEINFYTKFVTGNLFSDDEDSRQPKKGKSAKDIENEDSQQAQSDKSWAEYELWRKHKGLSYNEDEMNRRWQGYCAYRAKYGLRPVKLEPKE